MDESWRMCMGISTANHNHPPRKSMETSVFTTNHVVTVPVTDHNPDVADFSDVFGGPPRSVLYRKLSGEFTRSTFFYEEVFRPPEFFSSRSMKDGRNIPAFKIPVREEGFYSDIFGDDHRRSRSNSKGKSNSSSVLSSEELSPLRPVIRDDVVLSSFASKLRPVNVPSRWNSTTITADIEEVKQQQQQQRMPSSPSNRSFYNENLYTENDHNNNNNAMNNLTRSSSYNYGLNRRATSPEPEVINNSPSSPSSSLCHEPVRAPSGSMHQQQDDDDDDDEDEIMSSYVIEINSDFGESNGEAVSIDEAIAWAKERYNTHSSDKSQSIDQTDESSNSHESFDLQMDGHGTMQSLMIKTEILDDDDDDVVKLWSSGKENNIQLLLSTLDQILWPNSGWNMIPLTR